MRVAGVEKVTRERNDRSRTPMGVDSAPSPGVGFADTRTAALTDGDVIARVRAGERGLFELLMRRHNQRLYRTARAIVQDEVEVEDVLQQSYLNAFLHLDQFEARSRLSTWLTRIVINEASARRRRSIRTGSIRNRGGSQRDLSALAATQPSPEHQAYAGELQRLLERAVDSLPEGYRLVFVLRDVEGLSTTETASSLGLGDDVVKTRLHRARAMLRRKVGCIGAVAAGAFEFRAPRCDRTVNSVLGLIARS